MAAEDSSSSNASVDVSLKHHQASAFPLLRRLDQQFALEASLTDYQEGLSRASGLNKTALSSLGEQERRLRELQASLRSSLSTSQGRPPGRTAAAESCSRIAVDPEGANLSQIHAEGKQGVTSETVVGPGPQISTSDTTRNDAGGPISMSYSEAKEEGRQQLTTVPDAPTNFHATEIRQDSFAVAWDADSSDSNVADYEIRYRHSIDGTEKQVLQRCSRWLLKDPLPNGRYVVENLEPGTEYRDIALRCKNSVGWSEFCDPIQSLSTAPIDQDHVNRRNKFLYRIGHLEDAIKSLEAERQQIPAEQVSLARQMAEMQDDRMLSLHEEIERISSHADDELLSSDLLHGAAQVFTKRTLHRKLLQELTTCRESIAVWRAEIIDMDKESVELAAKIETKRTQLGERKAALLQFDKQRSIVSGMKHAVSKQPHEMKQYYLSLWKTRVADRLVVQQTLSSVAQACRRRIVARAWIRLCSLIKREQAAQRDLAAKPADGIGGTLLNTAEQCLEENLADAARLVGFMDAIQKNEGGDARTGEACPTHLLPQEDQDALIKGRLLLDAGHYQSSLKSFQGVLSKMEDPASFSGLSSIDTASIYAEVNGKVAHAYAKLGSHDLAIQYFGRQLSLAEEEDLDLPRTCALLGLGMCYSIGKYDFQHAEGFLMRALELSLLRGDRERETIAYEYLAKCCECLNRPADADQWASKLQRMDTSSWERQTGGTAISRQGVDKAMSELDTLRDRLVNKSAKESRAVVLEVASAHRVELQRAKLDKEKALADAREQLSASRQQLEELRELLLQIEDELEEATHAKQNVVSRLLQGHAQEVKAKAAKIRLEAEQKICQKKIDECRASIAQSELLIRNIQDDVRTLEEEMEVEDAPLMQRILEGRKYRCIALNSSNIACDDVTGMSKTSGVPCAVVSEGNSCYIHGLETGKLEHVFVSDDEGSTATITCLFFHGQHVYAGTMDSLVVGWDISTTTQLFRVKEHEAAVTCIHADDTKIVSGSADKSIIVWSTEGILIRRVNGHARGVHCIQCGPQWCVSASYGTVFVWDIETSEQSDKIKAVNCKRRFVLPDDRNVTAVQFGQLEVITGDNAGRLSVWWVESGEIQQSFSVHDGPVSSLQVDATKAVSAGLDTTVAVSDIIRGEVLHRLRGPAAPILAVAFDRKQILSLSSNGEMRYWAWGRQASRSRRTRKEVRKPNISGDDFVSIKGATVHEDILEGEEGSEAPETSRTASKGKLMMKRLAVKFPRRH